ncbi:helix-turn-helix domain-containing protein [Erwinia sp. CPCC 100877]|nr:helix-turn-helix domain-containing protein [Erwinia sp. CPCC 100877]
MNSTINQQDSYKSLGTNYDQLIYKIGSYHYNWHNDIELLWLLKGEIELNVDGERFSLIEDDLFLINPNIGHATFAIAPNSIAMRTYISPDFYIAQGIDLTKGFFRVNSTLERRNPLYDEIRYNLAKLILMADDKTEDFFSNATFYSLANSLLSFFSEGSSKSAEVMTKKRQPLLDTAIKYIEKNYFKQLSLEKLSKVTNYSPLHLSKLFKAELGINFYEYLTRCRLQNALIELAITTRKVAEISLASGFSDIKSFNSMFKKHFGITPSVYRKQVNPDLIETDKFFQEKINDKEIVAISSKLQEINNSRKTIYLNPCDGCSRLDYEEKYNKLILNLKELTS